MFEMGELSRVASGWTKVQCHNGKGKVSAIIKMFIINIWPINIIY